LLLDHQIQSVQQYFAQDSRRERARRAWVIKHNLHINTTSKRTEWNHSVVLEKIMIRRIIEKHGLDQDCITVSESDCNIQICGETIDTGIPKPVTLCTDEEIRRYVERTLPAPKPAGHNADEDARKASDKAAHINNIDRKSLSRSLKKVRRKGLGIISQELHLVGGKTKNKRVTPSQRSSRKKSNEANIKWLANTEIHSRDGVVFKLNDAGVTAEKRLAEMEAVTAGIQKEAEAQGLVWASCVVTLPPEFHPNPSKGKNSWNGTMPGEAMKVLMDRFASARAVLNNKKIKLAGMRTVESHQDGCPHVNFLIYYAPKHQKKVKAAFKSAFGKSEKLCRFMPGKTGAGAAKFATYATKYIKKYIKGGADLDDACLEEQAWASAWSIRRFQFFGIPSLTNWRSLRSSSVTPQDYATAELWVAARAGDFDEYIRLNGGLNAPTSKRNFKTIKELSGTGRSYVPVGIFNIATGAEHITKEVGFWTIKTAELKHAKAIDFKAPYILAREDSHHHTPHYLLTGKKPEFSSAALSKMYARSAIYAKKPIITNPLKASTGAAETVFNKAEAVTVILSYPSKGEDQKLEPVKLEKLPTEINKSPPIRQIRLKNYHEARQKRADAMSHRAAAVAAIVARRSVHPGYLHRLNMINADLTALDLAPINGLDNIH
jgi:hypothetical protein